MTFAGFPKSLGEIRCEKQQDGSLWTPRDALISVLREIDEGLHVGALVIAYQELDEKGEHENARYVVSTPDLVSSVGLVTRVLFKLNRE